MMSTTSETFVEFIEAKDIRTRWDAARRLMAAKQMQAVSNEPAFQRAFAELGQACISSQGVERLLAIDLIVRMSLLIKKEFRRDMEKFLSESLSREPEGIWTITESRGLPAEAKPAEVRENVAIALSQATGGWVLQYVLQALAREDRSQRCRLELCRQLASREPNVARWVQLLNRQPWTEILGPPGVDSIARLRDLAAALAVVIRSDRAKLSVGEDAGPEIARLTQALGRVSPRQALPPRLNGAAVEIIALLEEIFATDITLVAEAESYAALEVLYKWWHPLPYPEDLAGALSGIVRKLTGAIRLRARMGQRSQALVSRLSQALGAGSLASAELLKIAESEAGLLPEIDDWLRGRLREATATSKAVSALLTQTSTTDFAVTFAPLLLESVEAEAAARDPNEAAATYLRRLRNRIEGIALGLRLSVAGKAGEIVEFNPNSHRTLDGSIPAEAHVRITRPMVIRRREDGSTDVVERALVSPS